LLTATVSGRTMRALFVLPKGEKTMTTANWKNPMTTSLCEAQYLCADRMVRMASGGYGSSG